MDKVTRQCTDIDIQLFEKYTKICLSSLEIAGLNIITARYYFTAIRMVKMEMLGLSIIVKAWKEQEFLRSIDEE